ncbi:response regulator transcription factor [Saccharibacillus sacchari]|uniref:Response regulator n=1 Tax=Saccharibacillus sacchari TaxID=456493 RepID=A0ACC6PES0_9BACL
MYEVLLVDDEPFAIEGLKLLIDWEKYGFRIGGICENGEDAIRRIRSDPPDLVVTDIRMPGMDGLQLIEKARGDGNCSTLFVIASGYGDFHYALRAMHLGVSNYLTKPLIEDEAEEILERLSRELDERALKESIARRAEWFEEQQAMERLLLEKSEKPKRHAAVLERLSRKASSWCWIKISAESAVLPTVREAACAVERVGPSKGFAKYVENSSCGMVIGCSSNEDPAAHTRRFAEQLFSNLPTDVKKQVRLAIGRSVAKLDELRLSFESAEILSFYSFFEGSRFNSCDQASSIEVSFEPPPLRLAEQIAELAEKASEQEVCAALASVFADFRRKWIHPGLVLGFSERVVLCCASVLQELGGDPESLIRTSPFYGNPPLLPTLEQALGKLEDFCLGCRKEMLLSRECSGGGIQGQVAHFLRSNYTDTFTIQELADRFYVHPAYLGQSFTRKYGVGISEFVHRLRIEEACRLLRESEQTSCVIAERVGYKDYRHFLKHFEKRTGTKPAAYRTLASS